MDCDLKFNHQSQASFPCVLLLLAGLIVVTLDVTAQTKPNTSKGGQNQRSAPRSLFEVGKASHLKPPPERPNELKVVSYNIRWRGGEQLRQMIKLLQSDSSLAGAALLGLQEVDRKKKRTKNENTVKVIADELGMYYAWTAPVSVSAGEEEETGVAILSPFPLMDIQPLVLPHPGPGGRRRVALGATVTIGKTSIRFYSVHAETRIPVDLKLEQFQAVLNDCEKYSSGKPAILVGDFNTWEFAAVEKNHKLFEAAGFRTPFDDQPTFSRKILFFPLQLKLDWIWVRNAETVKAGIEREITFSDHWPLWATVKFAQEVKK